jgi:hypothetical protein
MLHMVTGASLLSVLALFAFMMPKSCAANPIASAQVYRGAQQASLQLRGGAFVEEIGASRGACEETGPWLGTYDLPHEKVFWFVVLTASVLIFCAVHDNTAY